MDGWVVEHRIKKGESVVGMTELVVGGGSKDKKGVVCVREKVNTGKGMVEVNVLGEEKSKGRDGTIGGKSEI
ncbi:hypothetical protein Pmani_030926 [Petrolisthes manimaculis]|uniref:Uncharacterized protein n=1 Tax=Petrolisthes manimaculis TaxID=1843537 RepID=A0AAE1NVN8_9EUCA|nr:hypothetical protein Pmani_030926 [Petrolisthes manimaculis]